ncbi:hypothetical protein [Paenibacillus sp. MSJ-34]|uniref:hypothetical protein n=1 Tax=Paenibacillus sp. MSJ-34 TaxID=2841529 RepID=UPI001C12696D|nr:hypothetical protein [Paenibacillus sp. MSJ-34]MBU5442521.1 hypothetical protein [Paenibacillus sp. MSJ-34]
MTDIVTYKIEMSLTGRLTQLPDSQRIFGALIYMCAEQYSSEQATVLVSKIRDGEFYFALSNMLPRDYLPVPQAFLLDQLAALNDKMKRKQIYQAVKKRSFAKLEQINELLSNPVHAERLYPYAFIQSSQQIHASIDSVRYDMPGLDPNVYSVPEVTVLEMKAGAEPEIVTEFSFYISADKCAESSELLDALHYSKENKKRFFLGARASQGLNTFVVKNIQSGPWSMDEKTRAYLNLGMLLPENIDFNQSSLKLFTSERRPYDSSRGWEKGFSRKFISFIDAGSIVYLPNGRKEAGRSIPSPFQSRDIVFGNAFLLPIHSDRGLQHDGTS